MTKRVVRKPSLVAHLLLMTLLMIPAATLFGLGLFLCITVVGIPVGIPLMVAGGAIIAWESNRYVKAKRAWEIKEMGPEKFRTGRGKGNQVLIKMDANIEYEYDPESDTMVPVKKPWVTDN